MSFSKYDGSPYTGEKVKLRAPEISDVPKIMKYWNEYESRINLGTSIPMSALQEEQWIKNAIDRANKGRAYMFAIEDKKTQEFLGTGGLEDIDWINRSAVLGISIHNPANHNKGYGTDAMRCLLKFGFMELNLNRIELWVFEFNERAIHVYEKVGFTKVGRRRQHRILKGKYYDSIIMDILREEYV